MSTPPKLPDFNATSNTAPVTVLASLHATPGAIAGPIRSWLMPSSATTRPELSPPATMSRVAPSAAKRCGDGAESVFYESGRVFGVVVDICRRIHGVDQRDRVRVARPACVGPRRDLSDGAVEVLRSRGRSSLRRWQVAAAERDLFAGAQRSAAAQHCPTAFDYTDCPVVGRSCVRDPQCEARSAGHHAQRLRGRHDHSQILVLDRVDHQGHRRRRAAGRGCRASSVIPARTAASVRASPVPCFGRQVGARSDESSIGVSGWLRIGLSSRGRRRRTGARGRRCDQRRGSSAPRSSGVLTGAREHRVDDRTDIARCGRVEGRAVLHVDPFAPTDSR